MHLHRLSNGLTLALEHDRSIPLVTFDMWVRVGSGDEPANLAGVSHFLEHMLFKGTERLGPGQYDAIVEHAGGYLNASTSMDYTHYYVTVPSRQFEDVFAAFADAMSNSVIAPEEVEMERQVIREEIRRKIDNPFGYLFDETMPQLFDGGPYLHPVIGSDDSVSRMTADELRTHYHRYYAPANMYLAIVGDVEPARAIAAAEMHLGALARPLEPWRPAPPTTAWRAAFDTVLPRDWNEAYFIHAMPGPAMGDLDELAAITLVEYLLAAGRNSRLVREIQERLQLVSTIGAYFFTNRHPSPILIYGTCHPDRVEAVRGAIDGVLAQLVAEGPTEQEFRRVHRMARNSHLFGMETCAGRASQAGYSLAMRGDLSLLGDYTDALERVTPEAVRRAAAMLAEHRASFLVTRRAATAEACAVADPNGGPA